MQKIDSQQTSNNYTPACRLDEVWNSSGGYFQISVADVFMQLQWGPKGQEQWTNEVHVGASSSAGASGVLNPGTIGVAFRSYTAGTPATVSAALAAEAEPPLYLTSSSANNQTVSGVGTEFVYGQITAPVNITATTEATANLIVSGSSTTYDGSTIVLVEFYAPRGTAGTSVLDLWLYQDGASIGQLSRLTAAAANTGGPVVAEARLTPTAGAHTYSIRGTVDAGTGNILCGAGGNGAYYPAFIRVTQAV